MHIAGRTNVAIGTLAIISLVLWLYYWLFIASADSGATITSIKEYGITREVVTYDWGQRYTPYLPLFVAGIYGAAVGAFLTFRTRKNPDRALVVFLVSPIAATISGVLLFLLISTVFYSDSFLRGRGVLEGIYALMAATVLYGFGLAIWTGIPAILGALAMSCFLNARLLESAIPPPLPR